MRLLAVLALMSLLMASQTRAGTNSTALVAAESRYAAAVVMERMHAAFPKGRLEFDGQLKTREHDGKVLSEYNIELMYERGDSALTVAVELRDAFGGLAERARLGGIGSGDPKISYWPGDGEKGEHPGLQESVGETEFSWSDLTLSFLWWVGGDLKGVDSVKGRKCYTVDLPAPGGSGEIAGVELWIDSQMYALLRARFYDGKRRTLKRFDVKSFAKSGDLWVPKDLDMRSYPSRRRTTLRVRDVRDLNAGQESQ